MYSEENAAAHAKLMVWLESVTPEELFRSCVRAGIYTETGELAAPYRPGEAEMDEMDPKFAYVTKYWATRGILKVRVVEIDGSMLTYRDASGLNGKSCAHGKNWDLTQAEALARVEVLRGRKVTALRTQAQTLERKSVPFIEV